MLLMKIQESFPHAHNSAVSLSVGIGGEIEIQELVLHVLLSNVNQQTLIGVLVYFFLAIERKYFLVWGTDFFR